MHEIKEEKIILIKDQPLDQFFFTNRTLVLFLAVQCVNKAFLGDTSTWARRRGGRQIVRPTLRTLRSCWVGHALSEAERILVRPSCWLSAASLPRPVCLFFSFLSSIVFRLQCASCLNQPPGWSTRGNTER
jgi:hypothetical protein